MKRVHLKTMIVLSSLLSAGLVSCKKQETLTVIKRWDTPNWPITGHVLLRYSDASNEVLLIVMPSMEETMRFRDEQLNFSPVNTVVRYSKPAKHFYLGKASDWTDASTEIMSLFRQSQLSDVGSKTSLVGPFIYERFEYSATCNGVPVIAKGKAIFSVDRAPNGRYVSVFSMDEKPASGWARLFSRSVQENYFVEIFDSRTCQRIGGAVRLEPPVVVDAFSICWTPDSEIVVFQDAVINRWLWFVPVDRGKKGTE